MAIQRNKAVKEVVNFLLLQKILKLQVTHVTLLKSLEQKGSTAQNLELEEVGEKNLRFRYSRR
jgi:hypothetical protein